MKFAADRFEILQNLTKITIRQALIIHYYRQFRMFINVAKLVFYDQHLPMFVFLLAHVTAFT